MNTESTYKIISKILLISVLLLLNPFTFGFSKEKNFDENSSGKEVVLKGFTKSTYLDEQILSFTYEPEINIEINAPSKQKFDKDKNVMLIFYALPNMNSIEETIGRQKQQGLDWHYDIQHIGAQVRFLRNLIKNKNIVVAYLETKEQSWPWWRMRHPGGDFIIRNVVDSVKNIFKGFNIEIVLDGHSGGGSFIFGYINSIAQIPDQVKRISFLDSEYDYSDSLKHGDKIINWLNAYGDHYLCAIAYDDRDVIIDGKNIGTLNGGTFFRTKLLKKKLEREFEFSDYSDSLFTKFTALNGRVKFFLKSNPDHSMWHTLLVEKNGFIESIVSGTQYENSDYEFWGQRAYSEYIQP